MSESRATYIGGSDTPAILGLSPWRSAYDVWLEKTARAEPQQDTPRLRWGRLLERPVAEEYRRITGARLQRSRKVLRHPEHPFIGGRIDFWSIRDGRRGVLEVKTATRLDREVWGPPGTDEVPGYYAAQCLHYLAVTGAPWCDLAVLFVDRWEVAVYRIERDETAVGALVDTLARWWREHVEADVPPPPRQGENLGKRWERHMPGKTIEADAELAQVVQELRRVRRRIAALEREEAVLREKIQLAMQDAEALLVNGRVAVTWKTVASERLDVKALRRDHPEIAQQYARRTESRRFVVKEEKDD